MEMSVDAIPTLQRFQNSDAAVAAVMTKLQLHLVVVSTLLPKAMAPALSQLSFLGSKQDKVLAGCSSSQQAV